MRERIPVVVQSRRRRGLARVLWAGAELAVTVGAVVLLLVVHQVWWTNRQAVAGAREQVGRLEEAWAAAAPGVGRGGVPEAGPGDAGETPPAGAGDGAGAPATGSVESPRPVPSAGGGGGGGGGGRGAAYAVLRIPRLGVVVPVAQGVGKKGVLDKGYAGHYPGTAAPGAVGNFALAGHRNTHGEPFRRIDRLRAGDELVVDVRGKRYVYEVGKTLPQTTPRDTGVIAEVPRSAVRPEYGYSEPGAYITLTTCTPEYSSAYRLVVWGVLKK
ncbi:class E sortase [Streptomyces sp. NPDC012888]|uniref:class E sortase n=1 Tax=Streptomyces sp. NPDC012888 TaxID=3364855 RepID=UPI00368088A9